MKPFPILTSAAAFLIVMAGIGIFNLCMAGASRLRHGKSLRYIITQPPTK